MSNDEVYMDVPAVREMAKNLGTIGETLNNVVKVLDMLTTTLKTVAFIGLVGGAAVAHFIDMLKPFIEDRAAKFIELGQDVGASADAFERGDQIGATRFY